MVLESIAQFGASHPLLFNIIVIILSFVLLVKAADLLIFGAVGYSKKFGISDYIIGFIIIGIVTSLPEFVSAAFGGAIGEGGIVFGTFLGSCVITITIMLGIELLFAKKLPVESRLLKKTKYYIPVLVLLPLILVLDGQLSRPDGLVLIGFFMVYIAMLWKKEGTLGKIRKDVRIRHLWRDVFVFLGALAALLLSARWMVFSAVHISHILAIPTYIIALIVIAIGTSIGDLTVDIQSIRAGHAAVALGDILSAFVVETVLLLGLIALIKPVAINPVTLIPAAVFLMVPLSAIIFFVKKELTWKHGIALIALYGVFLAVQLLVV